jgi:hypothetical protein
LLHFWDSYNKSERRALLPFLKSPSCFMFHLLGYMYQIWKWNSASSFMTPSFFIPHLLVILLLMGLIGTPNMKAYCTLPANGVPSFICRGAPHQSACE